MGLSFLLKKMTGAEMYSDMQVKADTAYSGYLSNADANRFFAESFLESIQEIYLKRLNEQNSFDELSYLIATGQQYNINSTTNTMYLGDYFVSILAVFSVGTLVTVTTVLPHDLITGTRITFKDITGTGNITALNGQTYSVTVVDANTFTITASFSPVNTFVSGTIIFPDSIPQYFHLLKAEAQFTNPTLFTVVASTNATPIMITLNKRSYLRDGNQVMIAGIGGNTNANGTYFLKYANEFNYFLYTDEELQEPVIGNGIQTGIGTVSEIIKSSVRFKRSDEKGSIYGKPTVESPFYQQSFNLIKILPANKPCNWIKIDYIRKSPITIDVANATDNLSNYFPLPFQYLIINKAIKIFSESTRDMILYQTGSQSIIENP